MSLTLIGALVCLAVWVVVVFISPVGLGVVHLFLALGAVLWIRWWALRPPAPER